MVELYDKRSKMRSVWRRVDYHEHTGRTDVYTHTLQTAVFVIFTKCKLMFTVTLKSPRYRIFGR